MIFLSIYLVDFLMTKIYLGIFENNKNLPDIYLSNQFQIIKYVCYLPRVQAVFLFAIEQSANDQAPQHPAPLPPACGGAGGII